MAIILDFETRGVIDLPKMGIQRYASDEWTQALCMAWQFPEEDPDAEPHLWHRNHPWIEKSERPDELIERLRDGEEFEAHNAEFEFYIWNWVLRREFPEFDYEVKLEQMRCSAAKASCVSAPRKLGEAAKAFGLKHKKLADGVRLINKLSKPQARRKKIIMAGQPFRPSWCEEEHEHRANWKYCQGDVMAERELSEFCPDMDPRELEYWQMTLRLNQRGIALDEDGVSVARDMALEEANRLNAELYEITGGAVDKFSRRVPLLGWLNNRRNEIGMSLLPNTKADTFAFELHGVPTKAADEAREAHKPRMKAYWDGLGEAAQPIKRVMEIAMEGNKSSIAKFKRMEGSVCKDHRLHDIMLYNGADRTGRYAGKGVQPHNFVRGYSKDMVDAWDDIMCRDRDDIEFLWGQPLTFLAKSCRGALIASPGYELYAADFNAIEARKLAWLSNCTRLLTLFQNKGDPYCDMASAIYKREITKADAAERQLGKKAILGLGYGMGWEKFQATVWMEEGIWLEDEFCQEVVRLYRKEMYPEIPALWKSSEAAAIAAVQDGQEHLAGGDEFGTGAVSYFVRGRFLHCRLPSGRLLAYLDPEVHTRVNYRFSALNARGKPTIVMFPAKKSVAQWRVRAHAEKLAEKQGKRLLPDAPETFLSPHLSFMGRDTYTRQWKRCGTHGGTLVENFDQASSRDLLMEAMYRIEKVGFDLLLSIHDEVVGEAPKGTCTVKEYEAVMSEVPGWAPGMPITAEGWIGPRLRK